MNGRFVAFGSPRSAEAEEAPRLPGGSSVSKQGALLVLILVFAGLALAQHLAFYAPAAQAFKPEVPAPGASLAAIPDMLSLAPDQGLSNLPAATAIEINATRPNDAALEPVPPFQAAYGTDERQRAIACLAAAAWYEAGDDNPGERAVIQVVLNRVRHPSYPKSVCSVVFQGSERRTGCQFTFTCDGSLARIPSEGAWGRAEALATAAIEGATDPTVGGATHYHADYVVPTWSSRLEKLAQVGAHIFYRFPGAAGRSRVLAVAPTSAEPLVPQLARLGFVKAGQAGSPDTLAEAPEAPGGEASAFTSSLPAATLPAPAPTSTAILTSFDPGGLAGRWALDARSRCAGRDDCQVIAWGSADQVERNRSLGASERDRPLFVFIRDRSSGMELAQWNCAVVARPDARQCLPSDQRSLERMLRERS